MITNKQSLIKIMFRIILPVLIVAFILASCGGSPSPLGEASQPGSPTQANPAALQPDATQLSVENQAPADTPADSAPIQAAGSLTNVCSLVTKAEAEAAFGAPLGDPVEENTPPLYSCRYKDPTLNYVGITVVEYANAAEAASAFQMVIGLNGYQEVSGIGDRAYRSDIYDITVQKGKYELSINIVNDSDKDTRYAKASELAVIALSRLP